MLIFVKLIIGSSLISTLKQHLIGVNICKKSAE